MIDRTALKTLRPTLNLEPSISNIEQFQNNSLRPILKLQHELLIGVYRHYLQQRKGTFYKLPRSSQLDYIQHSVQKDSKLRELLFGLVIGHFTMKEWQAYLANEKAIRKRLIDLLVQRLQSIDFANLAD